MSKEAITKFQEAVRTQPALLEKVKAVWSDVDALVALAGQAGFVFTRDELMDAAQAKKGELSEEELQKVAGGTAVGVLTVAVAVVAIAAT